MAAKRKSSPRQDSSDKSEEKSSRPPRTDSMRETIESVVIAFVLAFLFRTFEAEAFVIPTGSMAPTLMGRHKDLTCTACGFPLRVGDSEQVFPHSEGTAEQRAAHQAAQQKVACVCPNCNFWIDLRQPGPDEHEYDSYNGDRILVAKFPYDFGDPERWDVAVFKFPGSAQQNYIKRLVGLPGETIVIDHGDIYTRDDEGVEHIAHKSPDKVQAMAQVVYDNDYVMPDLVELGMPLRWQPVAQAGEGQWQAADSEYREYEVDGTSEEAWLRYRHLVPLQSDWDRLVERLPPNRPIPPRLISDFCGYNTGQVGRLADNFRRNPFVQDGVHWVGDLAVDCEVTVDDAAEGELLFELVEAGRAHQCRIDVATGKATISVPGNESFPVSAPTSLRGPGEYQVMFANFDDELFLWVDGDVVEFDGRYTPPPDSLPDGLDLAPVGIGSRGVAARVNHLRVLRDVYYIATPYGESDGSMNDYRRGVNAPSEGGSEASTAEFLSDPTAWPRVEPRLRQELVLGSDQFLALGDNSPQSQDGRRWGDEYYVSRRLLIGKAFFVYWPHSLNHVAGTNIPFPVFPNFARMRFVR